MMETSRIRAGVRGPLPVLALSALSLALSLCAGSLLLGTWDSVATDLFMRWRNNLGAGGSDFTRSDITLIVIDKATLDKYGLYGRGQWLARRPFVEQLLFFGNNYRPSVLAYDLIFQEPVEEQAGARRIGESPEKIERMCGQLAALARERKEALPEDVLYDMTRLSAEQGELLFMHTLAAVHEAKRFPVALAFNFRGGWVDPQVAKIPEWSDEDVFGDDKSGSEEGGKRIPYLLDVSIPPEHVHFPDRAAERAYRYSQNANMPSHGLQDYCRQAFINVPRDEDGVIRRVPLVSGLAYTNSIAGVRKTAFVPSFALLACMLHLGMEFPLRRTAPPPLEVFFGRKLVLRPPGGREFHIPIDGIGRMFLNFNASLGDFQALSFAKAARPGHRGDIDGHLVMVGLAATGTTDMGPCPVSPNTPFVHVHAMAANNILDRSFLAPLGAVGRAVLYGVLFLLLSGLCLADRTPRLAVSSFLAAALYGLTSYAGVHFSVVALPVLSPLLYIGFCSFGVVSCRYFLEERGKRQIRNLFSTMVSSEVLAYLEQNPERLSLEGNAAEATILFSDIADFTALSESLPPRGLSRFLNSYLTPITDCVMNHGGCVDKFVGDMVMAVWGAPFPMAGHAMKACVAALDQQRIIREMNPVWRRQYGFAVKARMGINSGVVAAGNMGSQRRVQYTVMGDVVNLASRLEPINRDYGTDIIIGEATYRLAEGGIVGRPLDRIVVQGKTEVVPIYELVGVRGEVDAGVLELIALFSDALERYYQRDWGGSLRILDRILATSADAPSANLRRRVLAYVDVPPPSGWRGEHVRAGKG